MVRIWTLFAVTGIKYWRRVPKMGHTGIQCYNMETPDRGHNGYIICSSQMLGQIIDGECVKDIRADKFTGCRIFLYGLPDFDSIPKLLSAK